MLPSIAPSLEVVNIHPTATVKSKSQVCYNHLICHFCNSKNPLSYISQK